jgi:hypothetical protein
MFNPFRWLFDKEQYSFDRKILQGMKKATKNLQKHPEKYITFDDGQPPSEEMIKDYYQQYCKKIEGNHKWEWTTEEPLSFEEYHKNTMEIGKRYLFSTVAHFMIGDPFNGPITYM